jgi:hypothetical protein
LPAVLFCPKAAAPRNPRIPESRFALGRPEEEEQEEQEEQEEEMADDSSAVEPALVLDPDRLKEVRDVQCRE